MFWLDQFDWATGAKSFNRRSLHHIGSGLNPYEQAISIIGKTLAAFDEDNLIPCFGFGDGMIDIPVILLLLWLGLTQTSIVNSTLLCGWQASSYHVYQHRHMIKMSLVFTLTRDSVMDLRKFCIATGRLFLIWGLQVWFLLPFILPYIIITYSSSWNIWLFSSLLLFCSGPTSFAPIIEMAMTIVEQNGGQYHVLLIIADGQV